MYMEDDIADVENTLEPTRKCTVRQEQATRRLPSTSITGLATVDVRSEHSNEIHTCIRHCRR